MALTHKDINLLSQKSAVAGTEKIPVSDTEFITPKQIASTEVTVPLNKYDPVMTLPGGAGKWVTDNSNYPYMGILIECDGGDLFTFTCDVEKQVSYCFVQNPTYTNNTDVAYATGYSENGKKTDYGGGSETAPSDAKYLYVFTSIDGGTTYIGPDSITKNGTLVSVIDELREEISELENGQTKNIVTGKYLYSDGTERTSSSWYYTADYIPVSVGDVIDYVPGTTNTSACIVIYDSSKSVLTYWTANAAHRTLEVTRSGAAYIRVSLATAAMSTARVVINTKIVWKPIAENSGGSSGSGGVTSVAMTVPTGLSVSGSPITSSGTLAVSFASGYEIPTTTALSGKEVTSNKVTSLSSSSTDTQYPSAKCVYDLIGDVETLLASI